MNFGCVETNLETFFFLGAQLLQDGSLVRAGFEVSLVTSQLDPWVSLFLVRLEEWRPLDDVPQFSPS